MKNCDILLLTGLITGIYDIILRYVSEYRLLDSDWVRVLRPYFEKKTVLEAALLAGFTGFISQIIILFFAAVPVKAGSVRLDKSLVWFIFITIFVSGTLGILMDKSGLFPDLSNTYYKTLGRSRSMFTDAWSGIIVQLTVLFCIYYEYIL